MEEWVALHGDSEYKRVAEDEVGDLWVKRPIYTNKNKRLM